MKKLKLLAFCLLSLSIWNCASMKPKPIYNSGKDKGTEKTNVNENENNKNTNPNISREKLMGEIEDLLGVPYRLGGTTSKGMDCSGLVHFVYKNSFNKTLPRRVVELYQTGVSVSRKSMLFGDLVFFNNIKSPEVSHVGIFLDADQFAHASQSQGVIISSLKEPYYDSKFAGARRVIE